MSDDLLNIPAFEDTGNYEDWSEPAGFSKIPEGKYDLQIVNIQAPEDCVSETESGHRYTPQVDFQVIGGPSDGRKLNFQRFSTTPFYQTPKGSPQLSPEERRARPANTSMVLNLLRAAGYTGSLRTLPRNVIDFDALLRHYDGALLKGVRIRWEGYCKQCGATRLRGAKAFKGAESAPCPECGEMIDAQERIQSFTYPQADARAHA